MKAILLVAGYATRLYPLTKDRPKALLSVGGMPLLDHILRGVNATIRRELGADISAACGQLRRQDADASTSGRVPVTEGGRQL